MFEDLKDIAVGLIGLLVILGIVGIILSVLINPDRVTREGGTCRVTLLGSNRVDEMSFGLEKLKPDCDVIEKESLMKKDYFGGKKARNFDAETYEKAVIKDFVDLSAKAWWMSGEGDISEERLAQLVQTFSSANKCMIFYAVKMKRTDGVGDSVYENLEITRDELAGAMTQYTRQDVWGKIDSSDQPISDYIGAQGYHTGGAVYILDLENKNDPVSFKEARITFYAKGSSKTEQIYAIGVGFDQESTFSKYWESFRGNGATNINYKSRYVIIAPYDEIKRYCWIQND